MKSLVSFFITLIIVVSLLLNVCISLGQQPTISLAGISTNYAKYHLREGNIPEKWEDGTRTDGIKGTYEWWYFDSHLEDSSTIVIVFYTKSIVKINDSLKPSVSLEITKPDGTKITRVFNGNADDFSASKDSCNIRIGKNYFRGNLKNYEIHCEDEVINLTAQIKRTTESWRPQTGHLKFGIDKKDYFAWLVPVPKGEVNVTFNYKGESTRLTGSCYHDHNWGNRSMIELFNHWYWSRAEIGPYTVIASEMIAEKQYDKKNTVVFNISKDGKTIADDGTKVTMYQTYGKMHKTLKKDVSDDLLFLYNSEKDSMRYEYYLYRSKNILEADLLASAISNKFLCSIAKLFSGFDGAYFRMTGKAEIRVYKNNMLWETYDSDKAVWELMYFGKPNQ
jgi:hypothetical protein